MSMGREPRMDADGRGFLKWTELWRDRSDGLQSGPDSAQANLAPFGKVMFPNPDDPPAVFPQRPIHRRGRTTTRYQVNSTTVASA
jgi:hypothetical protein